MTERWSARVCAAWSTPQPDLHVIAEAGTLDEAIAICRQRRPAVAVLNINVSAPALLRAVHELRSACDDTPGRRHFAPRR